MVEREGIGSVEGSLSAKDCARYIGDIYSEVKAEDELSRYLVLHLGHQLVSFRYVPNLILYLK